MVECGLPKPETRVRFPSPAPLSFSPNKIKGFCGFGWLPSGLVLTSSANTSTEVTEVLRGARVSRRSEATSFFTRPSGHTAYGTEPCLNFWPLIAFVKSRGAIATKMLRAVACLTPQANKGAPGMPPGGPVLPWQKCRAKSAKSAKSPLLAVLAVLATA